LVPDESRAADQPKISPPGAPAMFGLDTLPEHTRPLVITSTELLNNKVYQGDFLDFFMYFILHCHLPPLRFHCVGGCCMGSSPGLLRLWHWQSDALTVRLHLIKRFSLLNEKRKKLAGYDIIRV
jgi:hypothetical protein